MKEAVSFSHKNFDIRSFMWCFVVQYTPLLFYAVNLELVGISGDTTVRADESTILSCVGFGHPDIDVTWYRNGAPVSNTTLVRTYSEGYMSQGLSFNITFLQLCSVTMADAGTYLCVVDDGTVTTNRTSQLVVTRKGVNVIRGPTTLRIDYPKLRMCCSIIITCLFPQYKWSFIYLRPGIDHFYL